MHKLFEEIPDRILANAEGALIQANTHAVFLDPGKEHWGNMSVLNAAQAGELFMKAAIAKVHPLLLFQNAFDFDDNSSNELDIERLLQKAKSHDFQHLPKILWAVLKERLPDMNSFEKIRKMRNAIQHFYHPGGLDNYGEEAKDASLDFIYKNIDPFIQKHFGLYAIEFHQDDSVGYDHVVAVLLRSELKFSVPPDFALSEIDVEEEIEDASPSYKAWVAANLASKE